MKEKKLCNSRTIKPPDWHLERSLYHMSKVISHLKEVCYDGSKTINDMEHHRLVITEMLSTELKRKNRVGK